MKRILLLSAILLSCLSRASGVAALGDVACGIFANTATNGIPYVENEWLDNAWPPLSPFVSPWAYSTNGFLLANAEPADDAALVSGQLKWTVLCAARELDVEAWAVGGAGSNVWSTVYSFSSGDNDHVVTVAEFFDAIAPVVERVGELYVDSHVHALPAIPGDGDWFDVSNAPVALKHLKHVFAFDPELDWDLDGMSDWWERYMFSDLMAVTEYDNVFPDDDPDYDGLPNLLEFERGSDPLNRDADGDGLVDGVDPDPRFWTDPGDYDQDGVPDALETDWFGGTDVVGSASDLDWAGFRFDMALAAGICPTNPLPGTTYPTNGVASLPLVPRFGLEAVSGETVWEVSFDLPRHGAWEQYFLAVTPDPYSDPGSCPSPFSGLSLEWTAPGASGTLAFPAPGYVVPIPVPPRAPNDSSFEITLRLVATQTGLVSCPSPLYFLSYSPALEFPGAPTAMAGDARVSAALADADVPFSVDWSLAPAGAAPPADFSDELVFDLFGASSVTFMRDALGRISGGTLCGVTAGLFEFPFIVPPPARTIPPELRRILLAVVDPRLTYGTGHGPDAAGLAWDGGSYSRTHDYPLDDVALWRSFHSDATGGFLCDCSPVLTVDIPSEYEPLFATNVVVYESGLRQSATGTVFFAGSTLCVLGADHDTWSSASSAGGLDASCGCDGGEVDGDSEGSVRFRLSLGQPRAGQYSGFLWFRSDGPVSVTPQLFELLARSDASVSDTTASGVRTIACSDARGRTVVVSPIADGVRLAVTNTATGEPDHSWTIVNENGSTSCIRFVRTSRAGNVQSDRTYVLSGGVWSVSDNIAGTAETLVRTDALDDRVCPTSSVERVLCDSSGLELSHTFVSSRRYGEGASAVLREIERREDVGTPYEKASFATYWESGGKRFGLPRLLSGNDRAWSWTDYDAKGRPTLVFDQRDGAPCPEDGTWWTLASHPALLKAFATVHSYAPVSNDDPNHPDDDATPRTTSRYVVDGASGTLISRSWTVVTHGTTAGWPSVSVRTERAASQSAQFGDSGNAVSVSISVDPEAPGVPLLLRGRPLSYTDEDGVTTTYEYVFGAWDPVTRTFAPGGAGGSPAIRTRVFTTTPEAPSGVPLVSTVSETVEDATHGTEVWSATRVLLANGSLSAPFDWEARTYDDQNRLRSTLYTDGSSSTNAYSCCRLLFTVGRDGRKVLRSAQTGTDHLYYATEEVSLAELPRIATSSLYGGWPQESYRTTQHFMDALGRETNTVVRIGDTPGQAANASFSASEYFTASTLAEYPYGCDSSVIRHDVRGNSSSTERDDCEGYVFTDRYDDYIWDSCMTDRQKEETTTSCRGGGSVTLREEGTKWVRTASFASYGSDGRRTDFSVTETSDGACVTNSVSVSDFLGRTARVVTPLSDSTYAYDGSSSRAVSVSDSVSGLSSATLYDALREPVGSVSAGVSSLTTTRYELASNAWWRVAETREAAGAQTNLLSAVRERLTGLSDSLRSETVSVDESGVATHAVSSFDPATKILTETTSSPVANTVVRKSMFGRETERTENGETVRAFYDPFGRVFATRRSGGTGSGAWDRLEAVFIRNSFGDVDTELRPVSPTEYAVTTRNFDSLGNVCFEVDDTGHGRQTIHDLSGRVTEESGDTVYPSLQSWDALGRRVSLSTTRNGSAWDATHWFYDAATGLCTNKTYADGTSVEHTFAADGLPLRTTFASGRWTQNAYDAHRRLSSVATSDGEGDVSYSYDAFGRVVSATGASAYYLYSRDALGRVTAEARDDDFGNELSLLSRFYDACGRPAGYGLDFAGDFKQGVCYTWDMDGKLAGMVVSNAQGRVLDVQFSWDRGRLAAWDITEPPALSEPFLQVFRRDGWRPWLVTNAAGGKPGPRGTPPAFSLSYGFDRLGRPVSRSGDAFAYNPRGEVTNATISSAAYRYAYDGIGNRETAYEDGTTTAYSANNVNQYTAVGSAQPSYDADGNLVSDGTRMFAWSASGRLTEAVVMSSSRRYACEYDHLGRRVRRTEYRRIGRPWVQVEDREYVYDGWNLVHETRTASGVATDVEYFWGPDLSGTLQGAGGVGGLVAVSVDGDFYFPGYDNNGNVVGYWDESGSIVAEYAYDAFGNTISSSGSMASVFPHRFSTKYYDAETDLYYYGYRYYSPALGRWISRDPISERGGNNLYAFCANRSLSCIDLIGTIALVLNCAAKEEAFTDKSSSVFAGISGKVYYMTNKLKRVSDIQFDNAVQRGAVKLNGEPFWGRKSSFVSIIEREEKSQFLNARKYSFEQAKNKLRNLVQIADKPWDEVAVVFHGSFYEESGEYDFSTHFVPTSGFNNWSEQYPASKTTAELGAIAKGLRGKFYIISCYRSYDEINNQNLYQERIGIQRAKGDVTFNDSARRPTDIDYVCSIWFNTAKIERKLFEEENGPTIPGDPEPHE